MYSGFITHRHSYKRIGVHQRLDRAAYAMIHSFCAPGSFPSIKQIVHFEGVNGPDGLKVKSPGVADPDHFYDPLTDTGELPEHVASHYKKLVKVLGQHDMVRAAFEASWLAHYIVDGLTPAHHVLISAEIERVCGAVPNRDGKFVKYIASGEGSIKKNWAIWGAKGIIPTHHNFEVGIATVMLGQPVKTRLDQAKLAHAREIGYMAFFKSEAHQIAKLDIYTEFKEKGWTSGVAAAIRTQIAPAAVQTVGIIWLLAYLEAGLVDVKKSPLPPQLPNAHFVGRL